MNKTLSVSAIKNGTVIDHIKSGYALLIVHLFRLLDAKDQVTVGLNLPSQRMGLKDLIKIENRILTQTEANEIAIFARNATINIVKEFEVVEKMATQIPQSIANIFLCPNPRCIIHNEKSETVFDLEEQGKKVKFICNYCENVFDRDQVKISTRSKINYFPS